MRAAARVLETAIPFPTNAALAAQVGLSAFCFTRLFTAQAGTSPQAYVAEHRLRGAAGRLRYTGDPLPEIARDFGWASQATFTRAFSARWGEPPARFRRRLRAESAAAAAGGAASGAGDVRLEVFRPQPLFARRYLGPRAHSAEQWADFLTRLPPALLSATRTGLLYDDPAVTPPEAIRYDCAVAVRPDVRLLPELADQGFERVIAPGGEWACTDAAGGAGVALAYRRILADWLPIRPDRTLEGDRHLERFRITPDGAAHPASPSACVSAALTRRPGRAWLGAEEGEPRRTSRRPRPLPCCLRRC